MRPTLARPLGAAVLTMMLTAGWLLAQASQGRTPQSIANRSGNTRVDPIEIGQYGQAKRLPPLPAGMTIAEIVRGDSIFHGAGGCMGCHGMEAEGMPAAGSSLTAGLHFARPEWHSVDSLVTAGVPDAVTRSPIAMPARGAASNLAPADTRAVAAYVWAIAQTLDEPWPGGHRRHTAGKAP